MMSLDALSNPLQPPCYSSTLQLSWA